MDDAEYATWVDALTLPQFLRHVADTLDAEDADSPISVPPTLQDRLRAEADELAKALFTIGA